MIIHPSAVVSSTARLAADVRVGPFCLIEDDVTLGPGCVIECRAVIKHGVQMGADNHVFENTVIGGLPQHVHPPSNPGGVVIGSGNTFRENGTVHRALDPDKVTRIGDGNYLMVGAHVAHDCVIGDNTIITNNALLAGHVNVGDRAFISGAVAVHQFCRVGRLAMVGGQGHITRDVLPYVTVDGLSSLVVGLNKVGLRRAGLSIDEIRDIKAAYQLIYRSGLSFDEIVTTLARRFPSGPAADFHQLMATTKRGIIPERRTPPRAILKLRSDEHDSAEAQAKAG